MNRCFLSSFYIDKIIDSSIEEPGALEKYTNPNAPSALFYYLYKMKVIKKEGNLRLTTIIPTI